MVALGRGGVSYERGTPVSLCAQERNVSTPHTRALRQYQALSRQEQEAPVSITLQTPPTRVLTCSTLQPRERREHSADKRETLALCTRERETLALCTQESDFSTPERDVITLPSRDIVSTLKPSRSVSKGGVP